MLCFVVTTAMTFVPCSGRGLDGNIWISHAILGFMVLDISACTFVGDSQGHIWDACLSGHLALVCLGVVVSQDEPVTVPLNGRRYISFVGEQCYERWLAYSILVICVSAGLRPFYVHNFCTPVCSQSMQLIT